MFSLHTIHTRIVLLLTVATLLPPFAAYAEVKRVEIGTRADVLGGKAFGSVGAYEKIVGKVFFAVDPSHPRNKSIVDLDKAPRPPQSPVEFSADLYILKPKDPARGNGVMLFDVPNRGNKLLLGMFNRAPANAADPSTEADFGDGFLMRQGYTIVWVGWQSDVARRNGLMGLEAPIASDGGRPIAEMITTAFTPTAASSDVVLGDVSRYAPVDPASAESRLTVREGLRGTPRAIPRDQWHFGRTVNGKVVTDPTAISLQTGFQPGQTYELSYRAQGSFIAGLGFVAFRDLASWFKHQPDGVVSSRYAYVFGISQSGRFLRDFLYQGFNADERDRKVFDAVLPHIAGAARGSFGDRFAKPNTLIFFSGTRFPFLDLAQRDPATGKTDGLLAHLMPESVIPKIFYTNSSAEYWGPGQWAALIHSTLDGREDARIADTVRIYLFAGTQHVPGGFPPGEGQAQQKGNPNDYRWALRALLPAMDRWVREGTPPPASRYPRLSDGTLALQQKVNFPSIPGVGSPSTIPRAYRGDLDSRPSDQAVPLLVPQVDADGNERGGIRLPDQAVPLATYTGWNFRSPAIGAPTELLPLAGSYIPFASTRAVREQRHDPRRSIEERYPSRTAYQNLITDAARKLIQEGYLLSDDLAAVVGRALENWDYATASRGASK